MTLPEDGTALVYPDVSLSVTNDGGGGRSLGSWGGEQLPDDGGETNKDSNTNKKQTEGLFASAVHQNLADKTPQQKQSSAKTVGAENQYLKMDFKKNTKQNANNATKLGGNYLSSWRRVCWFLLPRCRWPL